MQCLRHRSLRWDYLLALLFLSACADKIERTVHWSRSGDRIESATTRTGDSEWTQAQSFTLTRLTRRGTELVFAGDGEHFDSPVIAELSGGRVGLQFQSFICMAEGVEKFRCSDTLDLEGHWFPNASCCAGVGPGVSTCACAIGEPDRSLLSAYRWASEGANRLRASAAAIALTKLGDSGAALRVGRLRKRWPDDLWLRALDVHAEDDASVAEINQLIVSGAQRERLIVARSCVGFARDALVRSLPRLASRPAWQAQIRAAMERCER